MLTGDNARTARAIGKQAGVEKVIAGVLPDGKEAVIRNLQKYGKVAPFIKSDLTMLMALTNMHRSIRESIIKDELYGRGYKTLISSLSPEKMKEHANEFIELNKLCPSLQPQIVTQTLSNREAVRERMNTRASKGQIFGLEDSRGD